MNGPKVRILRECGANNTILGRLSGYSERGRLPLSFCVDWGGIASIIETICATAKQQNYQGGQ